MAGGGSVPKFAYPKRFVTLQKNWTTTRTIDILVEGNSQVQSNLCTLQLNVSNVVGNSHKDRVD